MYNMWNLVGLWRRKRIILLILRVQVPTIKIETQYFHKVKALVSSRALVKPCAVHHCEGWVSLKISVLNRESYTDFSRAFGSSAMNSSFWASDTTHFTCTLSESVEAHWRVWKHTFTYGVIILCGNIAPSCLFRKVLSSAFAQKVSHSCLSEDSGNTVYGNVIYISVLGVLWVSVLQKMKSLQSKLNHKIWQGVCVKWKISIWEDVFLPSVYAWKSKEWYELENQDWKSG